MSIVRADDKLLIAYAILHRAGGWMSTTELRRSMGISSSIWTRIARDLEAEQLLECEGKTRNRRARLTAAGFAHPLAAQALEHTDFGAATRAPVPLEGEPVTGNPPSQSPAEPVVGVDVPAMTIEVFNDHARISHGDAANLLRALGGPS